MLIAPVKIAWVKPVPATLLINPKIALAEIRAIVPALVAANL